MNDHALNGMTSEALRHQSNMPRTSSIDHAQLMIMVLETWNNHGKSNRNIFHDAWSHKTVNKHTGQ